MKQRKKLVRRVISILRAIKCMRLGGTNKYSARDIYICLLNALHNDFDT